MAANPFHHESSGRGGRVEPVPDTYRYSNQLSYWARWGEDYFATYPIMNPCPSTSCSALRGRTRMSVGELSDHRTSSPVRPLTPSSEPRLPDLYCCWSTIAWTGRRENPFLRPKGHFLKSVHSVTFTISSVTTDIYKTSRFLCIKHFGTNAWL